MNCANTQILFLVFIFVWAKIVHFPKYSNWKIQLQAITSLNSENVPLIQAIETIHLSLRLDNIFQDCLKVLYSSSRGSIFYSAFYYVAFFFSILHSFKASEKMRFIVNADRRRIFSPFQRNRQSSSRLEFVYAVWISYMHWRLSHDSNEITITEIGRALQLGPASFHI